MDFTEFWREFTPQAGMTTYFHLFLRISIYFDIFLFSGAIFDASIFLVLFAITSSAGVTLSEMAPVGHIGTHFRHESQVDSFHGLSIIGFIVEMKPRPTNPKASSFFTSEQTLTHDAHMMHLCDS